MSTRQPSPTFACCEGRKALFGLSRPTEGRCAPGGLCQLAFRKKFGKLLAEADWPSPPDPPKMTIFGHFRAWKADWPSPRRKREKVVASTL
eukprot:NODE_1086_length_1587_cov_8.078674_g893_i0.p3 GENE.NODE_1086_length_1587_cov_8.078674_g893_i0~~NODE_1086_length_1587_cov_8.078674_g893_i0.p3  ORF type:complete len:91 (+),score=4.02 NODE_1086_length_1587_cov_8.078674_g893_i0:655-927(+)